jgi:hypothetical protein
MSGERTEIKLLEPDCRTTPYVTNEAHEETDSHRPAYSAADREQMDAPQRFLSVLRESGQRAAVPQRRCPGGNGWRFFFLVIIISGEQKFEGQPPHGRNQFFFLREDEIELDRSGYSVQNVYGDFF